MRTGAKSGPEQTGGSSHEQCGFETLIAEMSTDFLGRPASEVDTGIRTWLGRLGEFFQADRVTLWWPMDDVPHFRITHAWAAAGIPDLAGSETAGMPWVVSRVGSGESLSAERLDDLPDEASCDKATLGQLGTRSFVGVPAEVNEALYGGLTITTLRTERKWSPEVPTQLRLAAEIIASAVLRKRSLYELRCAKETAQTYLDIAGVIMVVIERDQTVSLINRRGCELLGYSEKEVIGKNWFDLAIPERERARVQSTFNRLISGEIEPVEYFENPVVNRSGEERIIAWHNSVLRDEAGRIDRTLGSGEDITERKRAEHALIESERRYSTLFQNAPAAIFTLDAGRFATCNKQALAMFGLSEDSIVGTAPWDLSPRLQPDGRLSDEKARALMDACLKGEPQRFDWTHRRGDGTEFAAEVSLDLLEIGGARFLQAVVLDITERKRAKQDLEDALLEISKLKDRVEAENIYLREEMRMSQLHGGLVSESEGMKSVMVHAEQVAATDSTVLILGETGTGKERLARAIHDMSSRKDHPLVVVNCAAMPSTLVESELFGREKGAYTGATTRQIGRFEVAHCGTIFLDEIGELSRETQAKLLRVLQEGQLERLGTAETITVDVRVIAATNRDLEEAVRDGSFREDLFYRLNVYPVTIPPLRQRREDIPPLVRAFVKEFNETMGKRVENVSRRSMKDLEAYPWPGNVRELRNIIERAMIRTKGETLRVDLPSRRTGPESEDRTLAGLERSHILRTLDETGWRVRGVGGAAEVLGLKATTLESRMKKLGIERPGGAKGGRAREQ